MTYAIQEITINASTLRGIQDTTLDYRLERSAEGSSGSTQNTAQHFLRAAPVITGRTRDLQTIATLTSGNSDCPLVKVTTLLFALGEMDPDGDGWELGNTHPRYSLTADCYGYLLVGDIEWSGEKASVGFTIYFISDDGVNDPFTLADGAIPTRSTFQASYTLVSLTVAGSALTYYDGYRLNIDHKAENNVQDACFSGGQVYPEQMIFAGPNGPVDASLEIDTLDVTQAPANGDVVATFNVMTSGGFYDDDTVVVTFNGEIEPKIGAGGSAGSKAIKGLRCFGIYDGSNYPVTITP